MGASNRRREVLPILAAGLILLAPLACGSSSQEGAKQESAPANAEPQPNKLGAIRLGPADGAPSEGGTINYGIDAEPEGLDPTRYAFSQAGHAVASAVFDPLATLDLDGNAVPYLATAFESSDGDKTWTIVLPTGVKFHDGKPLDAEAVAACLKAYQASAISGAAFKMVSEITATDATHVVIKLNQAYKQFPLVFTTQAGYIFSPEMITNTDLAKKPVGSGPFIFENHVDGQLWQFKKNPEYRTKGLPRLDSITFKPIADQAERNAKLISGDVDVIQTNTGPEIADLRARNAKRVENRHGDKAFLVMNTTKEPFDNITARRAAAYATDSSKWYAGLRAGVAAPANSPFGPGQPGHEDDNGFPKYDLAKAKELVKQYETETGKPLEFTFIAVQDPNNSAVVQTFAKGFEDAGMKVKVEASVQIQLLAKVATGQYQMSQFRLFGQPNPDADGHFYRSTTITPGISINFPRYGDPEIDKAADEAVATDDAAKRDAAYRKISRIMAEQVPYIWLGQEVWVVAASSRVNGIDGALNSSVPGVGPKTWVPALSLSK